MKQKMRDSVGVANLLPNIFKCKRSDESQNKNDATDQKNWLFL